MKSAINLKGSVVTINTLDILSGDMRRVKSDILAKIKQAPDFFSGMPVLLDAEIPLKQDGFLVELVAFLKRSGMTPIGIKTRDKHIIKQANDASLPVFAKGGDSSPTPEEQEVCSAKIISGSVRSGQQVYAEKRDLVVVGSVNPGAEAIADGHVYITGSILGKVFAGFSGMKSAEIFARRINPEMICIAGIYQLADGIDEKYKQGFIEISLQKDKIVFSPK